jgi:hypothetical protein
MYAPESLDPGQVQSPRDIKQKGPGIFAELLAGLTENGPPPDSGGETTGELRAELPDGALDPDAEALPSGTVSRKGRAGTAKAALRDAKSLSADSEKIPKKMSPKSAAEAEAGSEGAQLFIALPAALPAASPEAGPAALPGEIPPETAEAEGMGAEISPEEPSLTGEAARNGPDGGEPLPEIPELLHAAAGDAAPTEDSGETRVKPRLKGQGSASAEGAESAAGDVSDRGADPAHAAPGAVSTMPPLSPGSKDKGAAVESGNGKKGRERLSLEVRDLRSGQEGAVRVSQDSGPGGGAGGTGEAEFTVELRSGGPAGGPAGGLAGGESPGKLGPGGEGPSSQTFTDMLARELNQSLNGDIVRHASVMLRDGGEGTIRLSLKPESLGTVKIRLEMAENKIAGQIIVESNEALRAFEREIRSLEQAFRDSGFEGANLKMTLAGDGGQNGAGRQWKGEEARPFFSPRLAASSYDAAGESPGYAEQDILFGPSALGRTLRGTAGRPGLPQVNMLV